MGARSHEPGEKSQRVSANSLSTISAVRTFVTGVRQPAVTSQLAASGVAGQEFHQLAGNYTSTFTDLSVPTAGPPLAVVRSYNSMDPRTDGTFQPPPGMHATLAQDGDGALHRSAPSPGG